MAVTQAGRIVDYLSLQDALADELDRTDLAVQIPMFIQLFEAYVERTLRVRQMLCKGQSMGWRSDKFVPLPPDFLEARNVNVVYGVESPSDPNQLVDGKVFQATYQPPGTLDQMFERNPQFGPNTQHHFTFYENTIEIYPDLGDKGQPYRLDIEYYAKIPRLGAPLVDGQEGVEGAEFVNSNWLLDSFADIYLYGSLVNSAPYLRDDPRIALWSKLRDEGLLALTDASEKALTRGSRLTRKTAVRMG